MFYFTSVTDSFLVICMIQCPVISLQQFSFMFASEMKTKNEHSFYKFSGNKANIKYLKLECGPMPNLMVALPNIGGALCSTPQSLPDAHY